MLGEIGAGDEILGETPLFVVDCDQVGMKDVLDESADLGEGDGHHLERTGRERTVQERPSPRCLAPENC